MRGRTPVQTAIRKVLEEANTVEPYPVHVGWEKIAQDVYRLRNVYTEDVRKVRQAANKMPDVMFSYFKDGKKRAGAYLRPTPAQHWLKVRIRASAPSTAFLVESRSYKPPTASDILAAFIAGCSEEHLDINLLSEIVPLVNRHCGTQLDPSEVAWWRVGLEAERRAERLALLGSMHRAIAALAIERAEAEARKITFGPIQFDPLTVRECPCCHQSVNPGAFPAQRQPFSNSTMAEK